MEFSGGTGSFLSLVLGNLVAWVLLVAGAWDDQFGHMDTQLHYSLSTYNFLINSAT